MLAERCLRRRQAAARPPGRWRPPRLLRCMQRRIRLRPAIFALVAVALAQRTLFRARASRRRREPGAPAMVRPLHVPGRAQCGSGGACPLGCGLRAAAPPQWACMCGPEQQRRLAPPEVRAAADPSASSPASLILPLSVQRSRKQASGLNCRARALGWGDEAGSAGRRSAAARAWGEARSSTCAARLVLPAAAAALALVRRGPAAVAGDYHAVQAWPVRGHLHQSCGWRIGSQGSTLRPHAKATRTSRCPCTQRLASLLPASCRRRPASTRLAPSGDCMWSPPCPPMQGRPVAPELEPLPEEAPGSAEASWGPPGLLAPAWPAHCCAVLRHRSPPAHADRALHLLPPAGLRARRQGAPRRSAAGGARHSRGVLCCLLHEQRSSCQAGQRCSWCKLPGQTVQVC